jgi:TolB-like protein
MMWRTALALLLAAGAGSLTGCAGYYYGENHGPTLGAMARGNLVQASYGAADRLLQNTLLDPRQPVLVGTLVNVDRLQESSRFGRIVSEQIAGRMVQRGMRVVELKLRDSVAMRSELGELLLSREVREVSQAHQAQAVLVGTYAVSARQVYVSLKLVLPEGNTVVAAHDYAVALDEDVRGLLMAR